MGSYQHVAHQEGELTFFVPELFRYGRYFSVVAVPMLIVDLLSCLETSRKVCQSYYKSYVSCLFWKNHPVGKVAVMGLVMGFKRRWIGNEDYVILFVDDFTSKPGGQTDLLACKCHVDLIMKHAPHVEDLEGKRLRISGDISITHQELLADEIEICDSLTNEIEHWQLSLAQREELNRPWVLSREFCQDSHSQDSSGSLDVKDWVTEFTTPTKLHTRQMFIEKLLAEEYKDQLEIVTPHRYESQEGCAEDGEDSKPSPLRILVEDSVPQNTGASLLSPVSVHEDSEVDCTLDKSIFKCNETEARKRVLNYLLSQSGRTIPVIELYQAPQVNHILDEISTFSFNRQNLTLVKPIELIKTETFFEIVSYLVTSGLMNYTNQNVIDFNALKKLFEYSTERLLGLFKLQCYSGAIDLASVREKLLLPNVSDKAILEVLKEALRLLVSKYPNVVTEWWMETKTQGSVLINLKYFDFTEKVPIEVIDD